MHTPEDKDHTNAATDYWKKLEGSGMAHELSLEAVVKGAYMDGRRHERAAGESAPQPVGPGLEGWSPQFEAIYRQRFGNLDREFFVALDDVRKAIATLDSYRLAWAEIEANNVAPGRHSDFSRRLEAMQGYQLTVLEGAMGRAIDRIGRGDE